MTVVSLASHMVPVAAPLANHVLHVVFRGSKKEMQGINAQRVIASVANNFSCFDWSAVQDPRHAVRRVGLSTVLNVSIDAALSCVLNAPVIPNCLALGKTISHGVLPRRHRFFESFISTISRAVFLLGDVCRAGFQQVASAATDTLFGRLSHCASIPNNGGYNGIDERIIHYVRIRKVLGL